MTSDTLLRNQYSCLLKKLQFDLCLASEIFSFFSVFMSDFVCNGRLSVPVFGQLAHQDYNQGIFWSDKNPAPFPPSRNVDSNQSEMTCKKLNTMLVYFQHTPKNYIQDIVSLAACL